VGNDAPELRPAQQKERIDVLDALRGFAVFGMFMINIRVFSGYTYFFNKGRDDFLLAGWDTTFDRIHIVLFSGKFYTLFALLFGIGFAIQIMRASSADRSFIMHFSRRLFFLLLIGIVHLWGIWFSDILVFYAICGYLLLLFKPLSNRGLLWAVVLLLLYRGCIHGILSNRQAVTPTPFIDGFRKAGQRSDYPHHPILPAPSGWKISQR
jgi:uncharacterized protein